MGISAALFVVILAVTGVLLNHTSDFQLDKHYVQSDWVLDWYGIKAPEQLSSFAANGQFITLMGEHLYLNRKEIDGEYRDLTGAVFRNDLYIVAVSDSILLLTARGKVVERLHDADGIPAGIRRIGLDRQGRVGVQSNRAVYQADDDFIKWRQLPADSGDTRWTQAITPDPQLKQSLQRHYRGEVLPVERVVLDVHSGRFFGVAGPWLFDTAAVLLILLALSGTWIWLKRRR